MAKTYSVNIRTKRYLKKYLQYLFNGNFYLNRSDHHIKRFLFYLLERKQVPTYDLDNAKFACNDIITFKVGSDTLHRYGWDLPKKSVIEFNNYLEDHFREALHNYVCFRMAFNIKKKSAIEEFADVYNITPDDVDYDSLRKMEDRFRKKFHLERIFHQNCNDKCVDIPANKLPYPFRTPIVNIIKPTDQCTLF